MVLLEIRWVKIDLWRPAKEFRWLVFDIFNIYKILHEHTLRGLIGS